MWQPPGPVVPRQFLTVLAKGDSTFKNGSGRLELADRIFTDAAPLTARVFVNRAWAWHFGKPLVATPSDFGVQGEKPTHPELLDDLAAAFHSERLVSEIGCTAKSCFPQPIVRRVIPGRRPWLPTQPTVSLGA